MNARYMTSFRRYAAGTATAFARGGYAEKRCRETMMAHASPIPRKRADM